MATRMARSMGRTDGHIISRRENSVSIMEFRNGKVVHETQYFADPFDAPAGRKQWVQQIA